MKTNLEIIKGLGLLLLLFILVSAIAVSDNTYKASVTVRQSSASEDDRPAYTVVNTYTKDKDSPGISVTAEISGSGEKEITDKDGVTPAGKEEKPAEGPDSITNPPDLEFDESPEEFSEDVSEWIEYILEGDPILTIEDFPEEVYDIVLCRISLYSLNVLVWSRIIC